MAHKIRLRWESLVAVIILASVSASEDGDSEFSITIPSPDLKLPPNADVNVCTSVSVPESASNIMEIRSTPIPGVGHHILTFVCSEPGYQVPNGTAVWECGDQSRETRSSLLPIRHECKPSSSSFFTTQFQGGSVDEGSLTLPPGTGVPVGPGTDFHWIVVLFHFFRPQDLVNGSTLGARVEVRFSGASSTQNTDRVSSLLLTANGFVGANSVGSVSGSWTLDEQKELKLLRLYTHWHEHKHMAIDIQVWIERKDGNRDIILRQDPHTYWGISDVSNITSAVVTMSDRLVIQCTYNNTMSTVLRVEQQDMCDLHAFFTTDDQQPLKTGEVVSIDAFYRRCFDVSDDESPWTAINYDGRSSYHEANTMCA